MITLFFHNDPLSMRGAKSKIERNKLLQRVDKVICVSNYIKNKFLSDKTRIIEFAMYVRAAAFKTLLH